MKPQAQLTSRSFTQREVRDLAWALFNSSLFQRIPNVPDEWLTPIWQDSEQKNGQSKNVSTWLQTVDNNPEKLKTHLQNQRATRLGVYFEQLLSFFFAEYPRFSLLAKNLQASALAHGKRTIGEYDFIVFDHQDKQHYHIEVAVKFYIGLPQLDYDIPKNLPIHNWHLWVGPNKKDTLGIKMRHLLEHQLQLASTEAGKNALATLGLTPGQLKPKLLLTGRLYYPQHAISSALANTPVVLPPTYGDAHSTQQLWITYDDLATILLEDHCYIILPRKFWMSALTESDCQRFMLNYMTKDQLTMAIQESMANSDTPQHIAAINKHTMIEQERFFVIK